MRKTRTVSWLVSFLNRIWSENKCIIVMPLPFDTLNFRITNAPVGMVVCSKLSCNAYYFLHSPFAFRLCAFEKNKRVKKKKTNFHYLFNRLLSMDIIQFKFRIAISLTARISSPCKILCWFHQFRLSQVESTFC